MVYIRSRTALIVISVLLSISALCIYAGAEFEPPIVKNLTNVDYVCSFNLQGSTNTYVLEKGSYTPFEAVEGRQTQYIYLNWSASLDSVPKDVYISRIDVHYTVGVETTNEYAPLNDWVRAYNDSGTFFITTDKGSVNIVNPSKYGTQSFVIYDDDGNGSAISTLTQSYILDEESYVWKVSAAECGTMLKNQLKISLDGLGYSAVSLRIDLDVYYCQLTELSQQTRDIINGILGEGTTVTPDTSSLVPLDSAKADYESAESIADAIKEQITIPEITSPDYSAFGIFWSSDFGLDITTILVSVLSIALCGYLLYGKH